MISLPRALFRLALLVSALPAVLLAQTSDHSPHDTARGSLVPAGASHAVIVLDSVDLASVHTFSQLLASRFAGTTVMPGSGALGAGSEVVTRGATSLFLGSDPLVIVDGVRVNGDTHRSSLDVGGQTTSRLDDIDLASVERVELLPGPAAAAMYGTNAANGVILVTTRGGVAGPPRWRGFVEGGAVRNPVSFPSGFARLGTLTSTGAETVSCDLTGEVSGECTPAADGLRSWNLLEQDHVFGDGGRQRGGMSVSGGSEAGTYFASGAYEHAGGVLESSAVRATTLHAAIRRHVGHQIALRLAGNLRNSAVQLPPADGDGLGALLNGLTGNPLTSPATRGYLGATPEQFGLVNSQQVIHRRQLALATAWQAAPWLAVHGVVGVDHFTRDELQHEPPAVFALDPPAEIKFAGNARFTTYTARLASTAVFAPSARWRSATTLGGEYINDKSAGQDVTRSSFDDMVEEIVSTSDVRQRTSAAFFQQQLTWRERVVATAGLRLDANAYEVDILDAQPSSSVSVTGGFRVHTGLLPSASVAWDIGSESFFPRGVVSALRLRAAYGEATRTISARDVIRFGVNQADDAERTRELELGLDGGLFEGRIAMNVTWYNRITRDVLAPFLNQSAQFAFLDNDARVRNTGVEGTLDAVLVRRGLWQWSVGALASHNTNRLEEMPLLPALRIGADQWAMVGQPLGTYQGRRVVSVHDLNGDGVITPTCTSASTCEIELSGFVPLGPGIPPTTVALSSKVSIGRWVTVSGLLDHQGGARLVNLTDTFRCGNGVCRGEFDPSSSRNEQVSAGTVLLAGGFDDLTTAQIVDASFWRLRALSATVAAPAGWAARLRASSLALTLAGRNLAIWTDYTGLDPEVTGSVGDGLTRNDFFTQPLTREYTARVEVRW